MNKKNACSDSAELEDNQHKLSPILKTKNLTKNFGGVTAVDGVDLTINNKETHCIIGPNGAGKTTLFNLLVGSMSPTGGEIRFKGKKLNGMGVDERAREGLSRVFQVAEIFPSLSAMENLRIAGQANNQSINPINQVDPKYTSIANDVLNQLNIEAPDDGEAQNLSHGDKKKLEIGMNLMTNPEVLLLDEPTSGVSEAESKHLMELFMELGNELTILIIEHDIEKVLELSSKITVLDRGSIIATGTPQDIVDNDQVQEAYLGVK